MRRRCFAAAGAATLLIFSACGGGESRETKEFDAGESESNVRKNVKPEPDAEVAVIETEFGPIVIELYPNVAPQMVARFKKLIREGFYDGTAFHRINLTLGVVQGGDPNSKDADPENDGMGGSEEPDLAAEFSDLPFERGVVGAARSQSVNSANSQFYITLRRVPQWDEQYTVFGRVIRGMNNADVIAGAPVRAGTESPDPKILIRRVTLEPRAKHAG